MDDLLDFLDNPARFMRRHHVRHGGVHPSGTGRSHDLVLLRMPRQQARRRRRFPGLDLGVEERGRIDHIRDVQQLLPAGGIG